MKYKVGVIYLPYSTSRFYVAEPWYVIKYLVTLWGIPLFYRKLNKGPDHYYWVPRYRTIEKAEEKIEQLKSGKITLEEL